MMTVTLYEPVDRITDKAICLIGDYGRLWIPRSLLIGAFKRKDGLGNIEYKTIIPYWLAEEKGLLAKSFRGDYIHVSDRDIRPLEEVEGLDVQGIN